MPLVRTNTIELVVFTVLVYVATIVLQIYQPVTGGYFNVGEAIIYLAALVSSPLVAGIAGGIGAALADLSTGYAVFAPGTLIIKFIEGYIAGLLVKKLRGLHGFWQALIAGGASTAAFLTVSTVLWSGGIYIGPPQWLTFTFDQPYLEISIAIWVTVGIFLGALIMLMLTKKNITAGEVISLFTAGIIMVLGYFMYEYFVSNPLTGRDPIGALIEVPVNIGQLVAGISISLPLAAWLRKAGYFK
ncbi:MAG: ECF transporter S component [Desulfurococcaceae archaeon]